MLGSPTWNNGAIKLRLWKWCQNPPICCILAPFSLSELNSPVISSRRPQHVYIFRIVWINRIQKCHQQFDSSILKTHPLWHSLWHPSGTPVEPPVALHMTSPLVPPLAPLGASPVSGFREFPWQGTLVAPPSATPDASPEANPSCDPICAPSCTLMRTPICTPSCAPSCIPSHFFTGEINNGNSYSIRRANSKISWNKPHLKSLEWRQFEGFH